MSYPLEGETIVRTVRNQSFGFGHYQPDEPAPSDVAQAFEVYRATLTALERSRADWNRRASWELFARYREARDLFHRCENDLLRLMGAHLYKSYIWGNHRIRLHVEPDGCRRHRLWIEESRHED
jgi:hypothetical protein